MWPQTASYVILVVQTHIKYRKYYMRVYMHALVYVKALDCIQ